MEQRIIAMSTKIVKTDPKHRPQWEIILLKVYVTFRYTSNINFVSLLASYEHA